MSPTRRLVYRYLGLSHVVQVELGKRLELIEPGDPISNSAELAALVFKRAKDQGKLAQVWDEVFNRYTSGNPGPNPYLEVKDG